jgi:hypothetical protein
MTVAAMQDGGHEGVGAPVVARVDTPPILESAELIAILWRWR